ncbi:hypothetical protein NQZ68_004852 [Dissostichus eleginoides]|nr:hypothetical protein NQZ68_004852 [Dissostichus eleginoides]
MNGTSYSGNTGKERNKDQQGVGHLYLNQKILLSGVNQLDEGSVIGCCLPSLPGGYVDWPVRGAGTFTGRAGRTEKVKLRGGRANGKQGSGRIDEEATVRRGSTVEALLHGDLLYGCQTLIDGSVEGSIATLPSSCLLQRSQVPDYCNALKFLSFAPLACSYQGQCASESDTLRTIGRRTPSLQLLSADQIPGLLSIETRCA